MTRGGALLLGSAALAAALLAGCGGGSTSSSTTTSSSSTASAPASSSGAAGEQVDAAYAQKAGQICTAAVQQVAAVPQPGNPLTATAADLPAWASYLEKVVPLQGQALQQLAALPPPTQGVAGLQQAAAKAQASTADLQNLLTAAKAGNLNQFDTALLTYNQDNLAANQAFDSIGLQACGSQTSSATSTSSSSS